MMEQTILNFGGNLGRFPGSLRRKLLDSPVWVMTLFYGHAIMRQVDPTKRGIFA